MCNFDFGSHAESGRTNGCRKAARIGYQVGGGRPQPVRTVRSASCRSRAAEQRQRHLLRRLEAQPPNGVCTGEGTRIRCMQQLLDGEGERCGGGKPDELVARRLAWDICEPRRTQISRCRDTASPHHGFPLALLRSLPTWPSRKIQK